MLAVDLREGVYVVSQRVCGGLSSSVRGNAEERKEERKEGRKGIRTRSFFEMGMIAVGKRGGVCGLV